MQSVSSNAVYQRITTRSSDKQGSWGILGGASGTTAGNFPDLIHNITGSNYGGGICGGSIFTTTTSCGLSAGWYTYLYIPHRTGISSDNYKYGTLLVFPMDTLSTYAYKIEHIGGGIQNAIRYSGTRL